MIVFGLAAGFIRRSVAGLIGRPLFPDVCAKNRKWFREPPELFRSTKLDETLAEKPWRSQAVRPGAINSQQLLLDQWPISIAAKVAGNWIGTGDPL
ncbi:MAG: hypothetical protein KGL35_26625 [Bradyrhizobium sp.]|nr:hypothetical protein [Bradyrhizobium sp.]